MKQTTTSPHFVYTKDQFIVNAQYVQERTGNDDWKNKVRSKWAYSISEPLFACGNIYGRFYFDIKENSFQFKKEYIFDDANCIPLYQMMSPALFLYRLISTFYGSPTCADNYKSIWDYNLIHIETGKSINFSEHKGAIGFWLPEYDYKQLKVQFRNDLIDLMNYLVSSECAHPYDNLVAGSVA